MAKRKLPSAAYLRQHFDYHPGLGVLVWRCRPREDFPSQRAFNTWNKRYAGKIAGCETEGRRIVCLDYRIYFCHRVIYKMMTGEEPPEIDHINGNALDNRPSNLRPATSSQNKANKRGKARSGFKGVVPNGLGWLARIQHRSKTYCLGTYATPEEAHAAYVAAARRLHGEFANTGLKPADIRRS